MKKLSSLLLILFALLFMAGSATAQISVTVDNPTNTTPNLSASYTSLADAITALNGVTGMTGPVTLSLAANGTETAPAGGYILGSTSLNSATSGTNTITFIKSGVGANPLITAFTPGTSTTTDGIWKIQGADYITINGIDLQENAANTTATQQMEWGYALVKLNAAAPFDGCQYVNILNCSITLNKANTNSIGIYAGNHIATATTSLTITATSDANNNCKFNGNNISNVYGAISVNGFSAATPFSLYDQNNEIGVTAGNTISNIGGGTSSVRAIYAIYQNGLKIVNNNINSSVNGSTTTIYGIFTSTGTSSNVDINSNTISFTFAAATYTSTCYGISNSMGSTAAGNTVNINNNTVQNCNLGFTTGGFSAIINGASPATVNMTGNNVNSNTLAGTGTFTGIDGGGPTNLNIYSNTVSNNVKSGASGTMYLTRGSTAIVNYYSNTVNNNSFSATSGTSSCIMYGYYNFGSPTVENIYNNNIHSLSIAGTNTAAGSLINGIHTNTTANAVKNIYNNTIRDFNAISGTINGISQSLGNPAKLYNNNIYGLANTGSTGVVYGITVTSGIAVYVYNNYIKQLYTPAANVTDALRGINITSTTTSSTVGLYYNSLYLNASSTGANFGSTGIYHTFNTTATTASLDMRNNIIVNNSTPAGTGLVVAFRRSASTNLNNFGSSTNNNDFYAGTPGASNLIFSDGTNSDQTIGAYKTRVAPRDAASFTELPPFVNVAATPYDLHIQTTVPTQLEKGGTPVSTPIAITDDYDGNIRNVTLPDVGADEGDFTPLDLTPPSITFTPLGNTSSTGNRLLSTSITDGTGVPTAGIGLPVLYWSINSPTGPFTAATASYVSGNQYDFTFGSGVAAGNTVYYYIVAQDIVSTPNVGSNPSGGAGGFTANPPTAGTPPTTPNSYLIVAAPLSGDYTVGAALFNKITGKNIYFEKVVTKVMTEIPVYEEGTRENGGQTRITGTKMTEVEQISWVPMENGKKYEGELYAKKSVNPNLNYLSGTEGVYATITAAVTDLNLRGVSGPVRFLLTDASYTTGETYPITVDITSPDLPTAVNTVTIKPNTGVTASISGNSASSLFKLNGADYIIIDGSNTPGGTTQDLTFENANTGVSTALIWIASKGVGAGATYNTIKNCILKNGTNTVATNYGIFSGGSTIGTGGSDNDYNTIHNNYIYKAYHGINITGVSGSVSDNISITENTIGAPVGTTTDYISYYGIYMTYTDNTLISQNTIRNFIGSIYSKAGIYTTTGVTNSNITRNSIYGIQYVGTGGWGTSGIRMNIGATALGITIANNFIYDITADGYSSVTSTYNPLGILIEGSSSNAGINLYYNSIHLFGTTLTAGGSACLSLQSGITGGVNAVNNVFSNTLGKASGTPSASGVVVAASSPTVPFATINYNDYYVNSNTTNNIGFIRGAAVVTLPNWQSETTGTGQDANSVSGDPKFEADNNLHIKTTELSPVNNAGTPIAGITTDYDGNTRSGTTPDIGADEYTYTPPSIENPTDFLATPFSGSQINLGWTPNSAPNPVMVAANTTNSFGEPVNGQEYNVGDPLGTATIIYKGSDGSYSHSGLNQATTYYYKAFSYNEPFDPSELLYSSGVTANATTLCGVTTAPFVQDFELATFPPNCWTVDGLSNGWARSTDASGYGTGTASTFVNFYGLSSGSREMTTFEFSNGTLTTPLLKFDHAYATYSGENDQLRIDYSTNAGTDWTQLVLYDGGTSGPLNTGGAVNSGAFVPTPAQWATKSVTLPAGTNKLKFVGISGYGNNLFLDNIKVEEAPTLPIFSISPESMAFGNIAIGGGSVDQTFTITNTGGGTLTINNTDFTLTGTDPTQFQILGATTLNLTSGQSGTVRVQFIPNTTIGDKSANLHIVDNLAKSVHDIPLTGSGVVNPAQSLVGGSTGAYKPSLNWQAPQPGNEIKIDDGTIEGNYWLSNPSSTNHYFTNRLTAPHAGNLTQIAISAYSTTAGNMFNSVVVCPDDGTGKPNLAAPYETFSNVGVGTTSAWIFRTLTTPIAVTAGQTFYIAVQWPEGSSTGPYVATDMTVLHSRSFYSVDAGATWTDAPGNFFMRAYMNTSGDNLISGNPSPDMKLIPIKTLTDVKKESEVKNTNKKEVQHSVPAALIYGRNGEKVLSSYTVRRGTETGVYTQDFTGINALTYDDNSAVLGTRYYYVVDAVYTEGTSAHSNEVSVLPQNPNYGTFSNGLGGFYKYSNSTANGSPDSKPNYEWLPTTDFTPITFSDYDDGYTEVLFGGAKKFKFFGSDYTSVFVNVNGFMTFGAGVEDWTPAGALPQVGDPANMIAFAFRDLYARTGYTPATSISYKILADRIVISYENIYDRTGADGTNYISVQIALYISDAPTLNSLCVINYNDEKSYAPLATNTIVTLASLGLNGPGGLSGFNYRYLGLGGPMFDGVALSPNGANAMALAFGDQDIPLPVSLASFMSSVNGRDVKLSWKTESETNNAGFEIERSEAELNQWVKAGYISGKGTVTTPTNYTFEDKKLNSGKFNYRLKQIDNNGNFQYHALSNVVEIGLPTKFDLSQNYPNPFNPVTKIDFSLPLDAKVSIKLYDITGREVKTLVNDQRTAGYYTVQFNGSDISSGTYFYRIMTKSSGADYIMTKKMVLIK